MSATHLGPYLAAPADSPDGPAPGAQALQTLLVAADADAAKPEGLRGVFDLLDREIGVLQGGGGEGDETVRGGGANFDQGLVLEPDHLGGGVAPGLVAAAAFLAVLVAYQVTNEGESNWFEGFQLLALYFVVGLAFYFA